MEKSISIFLKGVLMGVCDLIPGISGGTIAFITGIYSRLINAVKGFSPKLAIDFFKYIFRIDKESLKKDIKGLDLVFLIILGAGIWTAIFLGSRIIVFLLENYFVYTTSFFVGLILASSKSIYDKIETHHTKNRLFGLLGLITGVLFAFIIPIDIVPNLLYVFLGGFLAISAMFLPGISGAFILLILGLYEFMLNVLHNIFGNIMVFIIFILGALSGMFAISRIISFLFRKDKCKTLYVLLGLIIGALSIPVRDIFLNGSWNILNIAAAFLFLLAGLVSAGSLDKLDRKKI
jgi:putative membrane protein